VKKRIAIICIVLFIFIIMLSNFVSRDLNGIEVAMIGDSIMAGYGNENNSFEVYFSKIMPESTMSNYAVPSSTLSTNTGNDGIVISNQVDLIKGYPELIIMDGGANDIISYAMTMRDKSLRKEIGSLDENGNIQDGTVLKDFENTILKIREKYPDARICYVQMFLIDEDTIDKVTIDAAAKAEIIERRDLLWDGIEKVCEKNGVFFVDISDKFVGTELKYRQEDWIHISDVGYQYITPYLIEELDKIY